MSKLTTLIKAIVSFHNISSETILILRRLLVLIMTVVITIISYYTINLMFDKNNFKQSIDVLINIDLSLFALQIATFTLLLTPFKNLEQQVERRKFTYIKEIEKNKTLYDTEIYEKLNEYLYFYNRQFRYNVSKMIIVLLHFVFTIIFSCTSVVSEHIQLTFLFANLICQLIYFIKFLLLLINIFCSSKDSLDINVNEERVYLTTKYKVYNTKKTDIERRKIAYEIERISREKENNG